MYAHISGNDSKNKLKGVCNSQSKNIKLEECKNCLDGCDYQKDGDKKIIRSNVHNM